MLVVFSVRPVNTEHDKDEENEETTVQVYVHAQLFSYSLRSTDI